MAMADQFTGTSSGSGGFVKIRSDVPEGNLQILERKLSNTFYRMKYPLLGNQMPLLSVPHEWPHVQAT